MSPNLKVLNSKIDQSVNFVEEQLVGFLESRFVRKCDDYFICYLSSQTGCNRGCKFCHLTATGQTRYTDSTYYDFLSQATQVFQHYQGMTKARYVHYNFMARGEALANQDFINDADSVLWSLGELARKSDLSSKYNVSTIMPVNLRKSLPEIFRVVQPTIYYSLYSLREEFRKEWLPTAMPVHQALEQLKEYQNYSKKLIKIHFCFIKDQNDSIEEVAQLCETIKAYDLKVEFNLVRYNPASPEQGEESSEEVIQRNMDYIKSHLDGKSQVILRVGPDVYASCGCFVDKLGD